MFYELTRASWEWNELASSLNERQELSEETACSEGGSEGVYAEKSGGELRVTRKLNQCKNQGIASNGEVQIHVDLDGDISVSYKAFR